MSRTAAEFLQKHPVLVKAIVLGYIVFAGCFVFPIRSEKFPLDFMGAYLTAASYGIIALSLAGVYGPNKGPAVYLRTLVFTVLGLLCRYFLEYGEVSNTYNFTVGNVALYLVLIPLGTFLAYYFIVRKLLSEAKRKETSGE